MNVLRYTLVAGLLAAVTTTPALALELGDPAPPLKIKEWVKGQAVDLRAGQGRQVYVIEFWATWCAPCRETIPHLSTLQKKYGKQVVFVGVSAEKKLSDVRKFVAKMGKRMDYVVAYDDRQQTLKAYMEAFKRDTIPHAFIVDKQGRLVWEGYPMFGLDEVLQALINGNEDVDALARIGARIKQEHMKRREMLKKYFNLVTESEDAAGAERLGVTLLKNLEGETRLLDQLSWTILTSKQVQSRDLNLALRAAQAAYEASEGQDPSVLETYARALWETGKRKEALKHQTQAVARAPDDRTRAQYEKTLAEYKRKAGDKK